VAQTSSKRAGFYRTWMDLSSDVATLDLQPFNSGLTFQKKLGLTLAAVAVSAIVWVFVEFWAAILLVATAVWAIWNRNNRITKREKQVFLTMVDLTVFVGLVENVAVLFAAAGIFAIVVALHLVYVWRRA